MSTRKYLVAAPIEIQAESKDKQLTPPPRNLYDVARDLAGYPRISTGFNPLLSPVLPNTFLCTDALHDYDNLLVIKKLQFLNL